MKCETCTTINNVILADAYIVRGCVVVARHSLIHQDSTSLFDCYQQPQLVGEDLCHSHHSCSLSLQSVVLLVCGVTVQC